MSIDADLERIALQEKELQFDSFSLETAWALGSLLREMAVGAQAGGRYRRDAVFHAGVLYGTGRLDAGQSELGAPQAQQRFPLFEKQLCGRFVACPAGDHAAGEILACRMRNSRRMAAVSRSLYAAPAASAPSLFRACPSVTITSWWSKPLPRCLARISMG